MLRIEIKLLLSLFLLLHVNIISCQRVKINNDNNKSNRTRARKSKKYNHNNSNNNIQGSKNTYNNNEKGCDLHASIFISKVLDDNFYPVYQKYMLSVPSQCPFKPERNMHRSVVQNTLFTFSDWPKCGMCGKAFYDDNFFHQHMSRKHNDTFGKRGGDVVCLADYCDVFRCDVHKVGAGGVSVVLL